MHKWTEHASMAEWQRAHLSRKWNATSSTERKRSAHAMESNIHEQTSDGIDCHMGKYYMRISGASSYVELNLSTDRFSLIGATMSYLLAFQNTCSMWSTSTFKIRVFMHHCPGWCKSYSHMLLDSSSIQWSTENACRWQLHVHGHCSYVSRS